MRTLFTLLLITINSFIFAQSYVGGEIGKNNLGFTLHNEIELDSSFVIGGFKTVVSDDPIVKLRAGFKVGTDKLHVVIYLPIMNFSLKEMRYNTPFNTEIRYSPESKLLTDFKFIFGIEIYKDTTYPYLNVMIPFK